MADKQTILVAEASQETYSLVCAAFPAEPYQILYAPSGKSLLYLCEQHTPTVIICDIALPDMEGMEVLRLLQEGDIAPQSHKILLSDKPEEYVEVLAFQYGADDYQLKPLRAKTFYKRLQVYLEQFEPKKRLPILQVTASMAIDPHNYVVRQRDTVVPLPKKEFHILHLLATEPFRIFTREELIADIWESDVVVLPRTVDVHIRRIRQKVDEGCIRTVKGRGYQFQKPEAFVEQQQHYR